MTLKHTLMGMLVACAVTATSIPARAQSLEDLARIAIEMAMSGLSRQRWIPAPMLRPLWATCPC